MEEKGIVTFSFDDAREDSFRAIKLALRYGISCTLNVTTGYVDRTICEVDKPCSLPAMTIEQIKELHLLGVEIACHGDKHNNNLDNLIKGREKLAEWIDAEEKTLGLASPHSKFAINEKNLTFISENFSYLRVGGFIGGLSKKNRIIQKVARIIKSRFLFSLVYKKTVNETAQHFPLLRCVPVLKDNSVMQIANLLDYCGKNKRWCILGFHSVLSKEEPGYKDNFSWDIVKFEKLCELISSKSDIVSETTINALKTIQTK